ncbi:hypothetical protein FS837_010763 [Tulasnella sp. UAMH 9824]|nr:hypothetical protein FS837_010763 [Tulasnella sp. UAMH 9824]
MTYLLVLLIGFLFVFGMIVLLLGVMRRDTAQYQAQYPTQHQHFISPVVFSEYSDRIRAMQDQALDLLEEEPLRGYSDLLLTVLAWLGLAPEDGQGPAGQRLGPQNPLMEVPRRNRL